VSEGTRPIATGDEAITELFRARFDPMVRLATLLTGSVETAEELVMDAFARVAPRIHEIEQPPAYLRTAVVNAARSHHRRLRLARRHTPRPEVAVHDPEIDELWERLDELRPTERACVVLRYYEDLSLDQVAAELDLPVGTVKSHLHRAISRLRALLDEEDR
jgi:RNA polymerase sigma-70 factor (sigma-E family)